MIFMISKTTFIYSLCEKGTDNIRYIGKTNNIKTRIRTHIKNYKKERDHKNNWIQSVLKRGGEIEISIIDEVDKNDWKFWEKYWISQFKTWNYNLTNATEGGEGQDFYSKETREKMRVSNSGEKSPNSKKVLQLSKEGKIIKEWNSAREAQRELKINHISKVCNNTYGHKMSGDCYWIFKENLASFKIEEPKTNPKPKKVLQISQQGEIIKVWDSISEAEETLNISSIGNVCKKVVNYRTAGGYHWRYESYKFNFKIEEVPEQKKAVVQLSKDGFFIKKWNSISEVTKETGIFGISNVCNKINNQKKAGGYRWVFESEKDNYVLEEKKSKAKKVLQISNDGEIVKIWNSAKEAGISLNISPSNIGNICKDIHGYKTAKGFYWRYESDKLIYTINKKESVHRKPIIQLSKDNIFIKKWSCMAEAKKELNISGISNACKNKPKYKTAGGFIWKYAD